MRGKYSILLNARKAVVITFIILIIYLFSSTFLVGYKIISSTNYDAIYGLILTIYAILSGRLYNIMSKNIILSLFIGILMIVLSWFAMGIGMLILTIYLLVKSNKVLKELEK